MAKYIDNYFSEIASVQSELIKGLEKLLPQLENLTTEQKIQVARSLDFMNEMKALGLNKAVDNLYNNFTKEITSTVSEAATFGASISTANLQAIETMRLLEMDSLLKGYEQYASDLKREMIRGLITGEPIKDLATRLTNDFGAEKVLSSTQKRVVVNDAFARLSNATTKEAFVDIPDQRFRYIGPEDDVTRPECQDVLDMAQNNTEGFTSDEIDDLPVDFASRGGWGCRHDWVAV